MTKVPAVTSAPVVTTRIELSSEEFQKLISLRENCIVVHSLVGILRKKHLYLTAIDGLVYFCNVDRPIILKQIIEAKKVRWI